MIVVWAVFWWPVISGWGVLFYRDLSFYALPMKAYMLERFSHGQFPLWTPYISGGMPFFAEPSHQVLYPLNLLFLLFADTWPTAGSSTEAFSAEQLLALYQALSAFIVLHFLLAQGSMYVLLRTLGLNKPISLWGALIYGMAGYGLSMTFNVNYLPAIVWIPVALACCYQAWQAQTWRWCLPWAVGAAASVACLLLAGDPMTALFLGGFLILWALFQTSLLRPVWYRPGIRLGIILGILMLAGALAAVQLLPTFYLFQQSVRQQPMPYTELTQLSFPAERLIDFIHPFFWGSNYPVPHYIGVFLYPDFREPWADSIYIGLIPVVLALGLALCCFKRARFWLLMLGISLGLAFGGYAPYYPAVLKLLPILDRFRYPEKLLFWCDLSLVVMASLAAQSFLHHLNSNPVEASGKQPLFLMFVSKLWQQNRLYRGGLSIALVIVALLLWVDLPAQLWIWPWAMWRSEEWGPVFYERGPHVFALKSHFLLVLGTILAWLWLPARLKKQGLVGVLVLSLIELLWVHGGHIPVMPSRVIAKRPVPWVVQKLFEQEFSQEKPHGQTTLNRQSLYYDDFAYPDEKFLQPARMQALGQAFGLQRQPNKYAFNSQYRTLFNQERLLYYSGVLYGLRYINGSFTPLRPFWHEQFEKVLLQHRPTLLPELTGAEIIITSVTPHNPAWDTPAFREIARNSVDNIRLLRVNNALPQAYLVPQALYNPEPVNVYKILTPAFKNARTQVEIADPEPHRLNTEKAQPQAEGILLRRPSPEVIEAEVTSPYVQGWLILTESWFPGWQAWIDGKPMGPAFFANHRNLALPVPQGRHHITLRYHQAGLTEGLSISLFALLLSVSLLGFSVLQKPTNQKSASQKPG